MEYSVLGDVDDFAEFEKIHNPVETQNENGDNVKKNYFAVCLSISCSNFFIVIAFLLFL